MQELLEIRIKTFEGIPLTVKSILDLAISISAMGFSCKVIVLVLLGFRADFEDPV